MIKDIYGWRARIGLICVASSTVPETEFWTMAPEGVTVHSIRVHLGKATVEGLSQMMSTSDSIEQAVNLLAEAPLHSIVFGGSSASFLAGKGADTAVADRMAKAARGIPVLAAMTSVVKGMRLLDMKKVTLITPYVKEVTERGRIFLEESGFDVLKAVGMGIDSGIEFGRVPLEHVYDFAREHAHPDADGMFISCANLRASGALDALEQDLGIPVVSANQAAFWDGLRTAGVGESVAGFGRLMTL